MYLFFISHEHSSWQPEMWNVAYSIQMKTRKQVQPAAASNIEIKLLKSCCQRMVFLPNCARLLFPHFFYRFPIFQQCGVLRLSKCIKSPTCGQPTNQPPPLYHNPSWMIIVLPCLNGWLRGLVANQRNHLVRNDGPSHRIVRPMVDTGQPFGGTQKPSDTMVAPIQWWWLLWKPLKKCDGKISYLSDLIINSQLLNS